MSDSKIGKFHLIVGDARQVDLPKADAIYADPPYYGSEKLYNCERVQLADLIPVMEAAAPIRALSLSEGMLDEAKSLIDGPGRTCPWVKPGEPASQFLSRTWEPVLLWGALPSSRTNGAKMIRDSFIGKAGGANRSAFPTPKPEPFAEWICDLLGVGTRPGKLLIDLFSGSGTISRAGLLRGWSVVGVDAGTATGVWTGAPGDPVLATRGAGPAYQVTRIGPTKSKVVDVSVDRGNRDWCPASLRGFPGWPVWSSNRHQWRPVNRRAYLSRTERPRLEIPGFKACQECHLILGPEGRVTPASEVWNGERVFVRVTVGTRTRRRRWLNEAATTVAQIEAEVA